MPYPRPHSYVTFLGDAYGQQEEWQVGLRLDGTTEPDDAQLEALATAFVLMVNTPGARLPQSHRFIGVKWAPQDVNGEYGPDGQSREWFRPNPFVGAGGIAYPQIACVISFRTARARGYASNGRMYLPSANPIGQNTGQMGATDGEAVRDAAVTFLTAVNAVGLGDAAVMSTVGAGRIERITGVRVGLVLDTQRRRRGSLPENYVAAAAVPT
jgi:hypothetical protein